MYDLLPIDGEGVYRVYVYIYIYIYVLYNSRYTYYYIRSPRRREATDDGVAGAGAGAGTETETGRGRTREEGRSAPLLQLCVHFRRGVREALVCLFVLRAVAGGQNSNSS